MNLTLVAKYQREAITPYISRGVKISQSAHHKDLFLFSFADGGFFSITSSAENILYLHPPDNSKFEEAEKFNFSKTQNYRPTAQPKEKWQKEKRFTTRLN